MLGRSSKRWGAILLGGALLGGVLAGCGGGSEPQALTIDATEYKFGIAGTAVPGSNLITLKNSGKELHHVQLLHLQQGKTMNDLMGALQTALQSGDLSKLPATFDGGVGQIAPGASGQLQANLEAGTYALLCFVGAEGPEGPHLAKGMTATLEVKGEANTAKFDEPTLKYAGKDYAFEGPETAKAGTAIIELTNSGKEPHEANLIKLNQGVTAQQALQAMAGGGQPPFTPAGGPQAILPSMKTTVVTKLEKGEYALICFVPDATNTPHFAKGMVKTIKVE